jgi:carbon-monoxide dehydrogenase large subunit
MAGSIIGAAVKRVEDPRFVRGQGTYVANMQMKGALHLALVRSEVPHGRIVEIDTSGAAEMPGVVGIYTSTDLDIPDDGPDYDFLPPNSGRKILAKEFVRFVGEVVVAVVAETDQQAFDAAGAIWVEYDVLPSVGTVPAAIANGAPLVWPESGSNQVADMQGHRIAHLFEGADHVLKHRFHNQRIAAVPLEPNNALAMPDSDGLKIWMGSQHIQGSKRDLAKATGLDKTQIHAIVPDMGGGFGAKFVTYPEQRLCAVLAMKLQRPVQWQERRTENLAAMYHGRGQHQDVEVGFTNDGKIIGLRLTIYKDLGAYPTWGAEEPQLTVNMASGVYDIPKIETDIKLIATNTAPTHAFRGAGRPEATAMIERTMDLVAGALDMDPAEVRRRNFIPNSAFPYTTNAGQNPYVYDSGNYEATMDLALDKADYAGWRDQQAHRRSTGDRKQIGIGLSTYVEITAPFLGGEQCKIEVHTDGTVTAYSGTSSHGQGHATAYAQILSDLMGIPYTDIKLVQGDTKLVPRGGGTGGSRSLQLGGSAVLGAGEAAIEKAKVIVANQMEASAADIIVTERGTLRVAGVPGAEMTWGQVATIVVEDDPNAAGLEADFRFDTKGATFPFGAHICVVEVDTETGETEILKMVTSDDAGKVMNPILIQGQVHGGVAQGIGQALIEQVVYDEEGYLLSGNLTTYLIPSALDVPAIDVTNPQTPTLHNPLGAKGIGEAGTIGSTPAVHNAVLDAIRHLGVDHIDMPLTPNRVWAALQASR